MQQGLSIYCVLLISSGEAFERIESLFREGAGVIPKGAGVRWAGLSQSGSSWRASVILERP